MDALSIALTGNLCASVLMTGMVFFIHFVQYPLLRHVPFFDFTCYFKKYKSRIAWIIYPVISIQIIFATSLAFMPLPSKLQLPILFIYILLACIMMNTFLIQTPLEQKLRLSFDEVLWSKIMFYSRLCLFSSALLNIVLCWIILFLDV